MKALLKVTLIALVLAVGMAFAANTTGTMTVTATVANGCTVQSASLDFGSYTGAVSDVDGKITLNCTNGASATIKLGQGDNGSGAGTDTVTRALKAGGAETLAYELYSNAGRTTAWGDLTGLNVTGTGANQDVPVYGRIAGSQAVPAGSYQDHVTVTVSF